ncbi:glyoxalase/bleomycin resistance/dioxygenase family protein [Mycobacterium sp. ACS4331]|uniref:VOC family protein n=1 Tax=Mycobacterium sp. ACS4331 TaxID=1834121 RepID=UPI0008017FF0|nr:glyoxalase/bleomycin resistance/dioxygenase family protein [Mycobacterium sp. ACS4331]OBF29700.1 glyoxalase [Mycobacterium sp. ACS4331]
MPVTVDTVDVADEPETWEKAGFMVQNGVCRVGGVCIRLVGRDRGKGIVAWALRDLPADAPNNLDGIPLTTAAEPTEPVTHANGAASIDHIVLLTPNLTRTIETLAKVGLEPRRERDAELGGRQVKQIFYRLGEPILEMVGSPDTAEEGPSRLWGITYVVDDVDATAEFFGEHRTPVKDAVQPGRRITTVQHRAFGMSVPTAMISTPIL